jgi:ketosteroid isomerase-like protein
MKPDYAAAHENLGDIYARLAIQSYEQAQQSDPAGGALAKRKAIEQALGATGEPAPAVGSAASEPVREQVMIEPPPRKAAPEPDASIVSDREAVLKTVGDWAAAWSRRDVNAYLGYYASDFQTPAHVSRRKWERSRRARIAGRNSIEVRIESPQVTFVDDKATVRFHQVYSANAYQDETNKSLALAKQKSGAWKIVQERAE